MDFFRSHTRMPLFPDWHDRLERTIPAGSTPTPTFAIPRSPAFFAERITLVSTADEARNMAEFASQRPLAWIGFDAAFRHDRPGVWVGPGQVAHDPRSIRPLLLSLALAEPDEQEDGRLYRFVVDLRQPCVLDSVRAVLRLPVCFVGHAVQPELFCLWKLGLSEPRTVWDTWVHEKAFGLGRRHRRYWMRPGTGYQDRMRADAEADAEEAFHCGLSSTCQRYGVEYPFDGCKDRVRRSLLDQPDDASFSQEQIESTMSEATAAARLYPAQVLRATQAGILQHLTTVEMPWVVTNARMAWRGVRVDAEQCSLASAACQRHLAQLQPRLVELDAPSVFSNQQLEDFFRRVGLLDLFRRDGRYSFDRDLLAAFRDRHPAIPLILATRKVLDLQQEKILTGRFVGADGRVHPDYCHLGTHSGRQTSRWPNVLGLGRLFRPLIVPEPGRGIGEVDLCQIEVGVAAAVYQDDRLVEMFNSGDVYSAMAQDFYRDRLSEEDRRLLGREFKKKHGELRNRMKTCTLGIIYGLTPHGLALYLDTSKAQAAALQERFMAMFPALKHSLREAAAFGSQRGYATTVTGLRRYRAGDKRSPTSWERNWMTNQPVQGSAAAVFKAAGNRLDRLYRRHDAWLTIAVHDAYVFEAPIGVLGEVAELTGRVLCDTVQEYFPELSPRVEVNTEQPQCWNKDGHADAVERWIEDPTYTF
jgi:DNA polymerase-1